MMTPAEEREERKVKALEKQADAFEKMTWRFLLLCIGQGGILASSFLLYITFLMAFFQGNELVIYTNHYGEALLEFFVLPVLIVIGMHSVNELLLKGK